MPIRSMVKALPCSRTTILLSVLALSVLVNIHFILLPNPWLATLAAFVTVFILPGYFLLRLIFNDEALSGWELIPVAFVLGAGLLNTIAVLLLALQSDLVVFSWLSAALNLILGGMYLYFISFKTTENSAPSERRVDPPNPVLWAGVGLSAAGSLYLYLATVSTWSFGDNWFYLRYLRYYLDHSLIAGVNPLLGVEPSTGGAFARASFNGWWISQALLYKVIGFELVHIYSFYLPPLLMIVSLLAFYSLAKELLHSQNAALLATWVQLLYCLSSLSSHDWIGRGFFDRMIEDKFLVWFILLPVATLLTLKYLACGRRRNLFALMISLIALAFTHPLGLVQWGLSVASFLLVSLPFNLKRSYLTRLTIILIPLLLLFIVLWFQWQVMKTTAVFRYVSFNQAEVALSQTRLLLFSALQNRYMAHPHLLAQPLSLLALLLTPLLLRNIRQSVAAQFLFSNMVIPLLLLYNPITAPLLGQLITPWLLWRLTWLCPVALTIGFFLYQGITWLGQWLAKVPIMTIFLVPKREFRNQKDGRCIADKPSLAQSPYLVPFITAVMMLVMALPLSGYIADGWSLLQQRRDNTLTEAELSLLAYLAEVAPPGSVVMAEPTMNNHIPAFASSVHVLTFRGIPAHFSVAADIERFYQSSLVDKALLDIISRWQIGYVIIKSNHPLVLQFERLPASFTRLYKKAGYELYQVLPDTETQPVIAGNSYFVQEAWLEALAAYRQALRLKPDDALAYLGLGKVYQAQDKIAQAQVAYQQAIAAQPDNVLAHLALAWLYEIEGKRTAAIDQIQMALTLRPDYLPLFEALGDFYLAQGREEKAFEQYRQAILPTPDEGEYYLALGNLCRIKGLPEKAMIAYQKVITLETAGTNRGFLWPGEFVTTPDPRLAHTRQAYLGLGLLYESEGRLDEAIAIYKQGINFIPNSESLHTRLSNLYLQLKHPEKAVMLYQVAARYNFNSAWPHLELGQLYLRYKDRLFSQTGVWPWEQPQAAGGLAAAITEFQQAIELEPSNRQAYYHLSLAYQRTGQPDKAIATYQQAVLTNDGWSWPWVGLGQLYLEYGQVEAAIAQFKQGTNREFDYLDAYSSLSRAYLKQGQPTAALLVYEKAMTANPGRAWPLLGLAEIYLALGDQQQALIAYRQAIAREPTQADAYIQMGNFYRWQLNQPEQALRYYRQAVVLAPAEAQFHGTLAATLLAVNREAEALPELKLALALAKNNSRVYLEVGTVLMARQDWPHLIQLYEHALRRKVANATIYLQLGDAYQRLNQPEQARRYYQQAARLWPKNLQLQQRLDR